MCKSLKHIKFDPISAKGVPTLVWRCVLDNLFSLSFDGLSSSLSLRLWKEHAAFLFTWLHKAVKAVLLAILSLGWPQLIKSDRIHHTVVFQALCEVIARKNITWRVFRFWFKCTRNNGPNLLSSGPWRQGSSSFTASLWTGMRQGNLQEQNCTKDSSSINKSTSLTHWIFFYWRRCAKWTGQEIKKKRPKVVAKVFSFNCRRYYNISYHYCYREAILGSWTTTNTYWFLGDIKISSCFERILTKEMSSVPSPSSSSSWAWTSPCSSWLGIDFT